MSLVRQLDPRLKVVDEQRSRRGGEGTRGRESLIGISQNTNHCQEGETSSFFFQSMLISFSSGGEFFTIHTLWYFNTLSFYAQN